MTAKTALAAGADELIPAAFTKRLIIDQQITSFETGRRVCANHR